MTSSMERLVYVQHHFFNQGEELRRDLFSYVKYCDVSALKRFHF